MLYLLDANVLITAQNEYYPIDQVPEWWAWLNYVGKQSQVKMPVEIIEEVKAGRKDDLYTWIRDQENRSALLLQETVEIELVRQVVRKGYADDLTDDEIEEIGRDPFLIAYAMVNENRCVVTTEVSRPGKKRQNRKIPDVCQIMGVRCCNPFTMNRELNFRTGWRL